MKFGICGNAETAALVVGIGYDYLEMSVGNLLKPKEDESVFRGVLAEVRETGLPCEAVNGLVPGELKICGPDADPEALRSYIKTMMARTEAAGIGLAVFGSGGARRIPDGFDPTVAHEQLVAFGSMAASIAKGHGVTIAVEPLNKKECNVLTTVAECAQLVREVDHPNFRLLVDGYHLMADDDSYESIVDNADILVHVHLATRDNRRVPGMEPCDLSKFFESLAQAGYTGRVSIEARREPDDDLAAALELMKEYLDEAS